MTNIITTPVTMTSLELVDFINASRKEGEAVLRHNNFMAKVPKVLGEEGAAKFLATAFYTANNVQHERNIYNFPNLSQQL